MLKLFLVFVACESLIPLLGFVFKNALPVINDRSRLIPDFRVTILGEEYKSAEGVSLLNKLRA